MGRSELGLILLIVLVVGLGGCAEESAPEPVASEPVEVAIDPEVKTLHEAAFAGDLATVKAFVDAGWDVNGRDEMEWTPLFWACPSGHVDIARFLVEQGADVNARGKGGQTALLLATVSEHREIVRMILEAGADPNARDDAGRSPLYLARELKYNEIIELLEQHGGR